MKEINFGGQTLILDPSGLLLWPAQSLAVVSDLHLEKASYFAKKGQFLPQQETIETLKNLSNDLEFSTAQKVIFLGDTFHDEQAFDRMHEEAKSLFSKLCKIYEIFIIIGNHDGSFKPPDTKALYELEIENIVFRHEAQPKSQTPEISGHYHPKARLSWRGSKLSRPCFLHSADRIIMPAFGTLTGGLDVTHQQIQQFFKKDWSAHLLGERRIYTVPRKKII